MRGLFFSADTVQDNLQGYDPYAYVGGNPVTLTDPTGRRVVGCLPGEDCGGRGGLGGIGGRGTTGYWIQAGPSVLDHIKTTLGGAKTFIAATKAAMNGFMGKIAQALADVGATASHGVPALDVAEVYEALKLKNTYSGKMFAWFSYQRPGCVQCLNGINSVLGVAVNVLALFIAAIDLYQQSQKPEEERNPLTVVSDVATMAASGAALAAELFKKKKNERLAEALSLVAALAGVAAFVTALEAMASPPSSPPSGKQQDNDDRRQGSGGGGPPLPPLIPSALFLPAMQPQVEGGNGQRGPAGSLFWSPPGSAWDAPINQWWSM